MNTTLETELAPIVRPLAASDRNRWGVLRRRLWPDLTAEENERELDWILEGHTGTMVFVLDPGGTREIEGFIELSLRPNPDTFQGERIPYVEGWYVEPSNRGRGWGRMLVEAAGTWALSLGFDILGSDALLENEVSRRAHARLGFEEVEHLVVFRKRLR